MKREGLEFREALHMLADRAGVRYQQEQANVQQDTTPKATVIEANETAARWFSQMLLSSEGAQAREYLTSRGMDTGVAERRGIGYAPGGGNLTLGGHMRTSSVTPQAARDAKLVVQGADRNWRDFFHNRLTIQISDRSGKPIGFGARSLDGSEPKYLNTPQTSVFDKSSVLYGLNWSVDSMRQSRRAVVVEGYMDAITAHEHGFTNVVASMGTAVTPEQLKTLSRIVSGGDESGEVILCLDSDAAGQDATLRALETAWQQFGANLTGSRESGLRVRVAQPVGGKDPDEAIRADAWAWRKSLDDAVPLIDFIMRVYVSQHDTSAGAGKARVVEAVSPLIFSLSNDYDRDQHWEQLATLLDVSAERLRSMAARPSTRSRSARRTGPKPTEDISTDQLGAALSRTINGIEEHVLALVFQWPELREFAEAIPAEHFLDTVNRELFVAWAKFSTTDEMMETLSSDLAEVVARLQVVTIPPSDHAQRVREITQCVRRLRERYTRNLIVDTESVLKEQEGLLEPEPREDLRNKTRHLSDSLKNVFEAGATGRI